MPLDEQYTPDPAQPRGAFLEGGRGLSRPMPALTVVSMPDLARVGDRCRLPALLGEGVVKLSRNEPAFGSGPQARPLGARQLSRKGVVLERLGGVLRVRRNQGGMALRIDGALVEHLRDILPEELERGVVLTVAEQVVLLLHLLGSADVDPPPALGLVGDSEALGDLRRAILAAAEVRGPALIEGEPGTDAAPVARALHDSGPRAARPFVGVKMGTELGDTDMRELIGARDGPDGAIRRADTGTLYVERVDAASGGAQAGLLRLLQSGTVQPIGEKKAVAVDVRLIVSTMVDLTAARRARTFVGPLLQALETRVRVPPLRARREDIPRLMVSALREELRALGEAKRLVPRPGADPWLPASLMAELVGLAWPGNDRQLQRFARQLALVSSGSATALVDDGVRRSLERARGASPS